MSGAVDVALVGEDTTHAVLLGVLLRETIREAAGAAGREWIVDNLEHEPAFIGGVDLTGFIPGLRYTSALTPLPPPSARPTIGGRAVRLRGLIDGAPREVESKKWQYLLLELLSRSPKPGALLVARDTDGEPTNLDGLRQVAAYFTGLDPSLRVVVAAPHRDAECWLVAGVEPANDREREAHAAVQRELSFNPLMSSDRLTGQPNDAPTDAKRVLRRLLCLDVASRPLTPAELRDYHPRLLSDLKRLRDRGERSGLMAFLDALGADVVPLFVV
jgi:hypothetical protein